MTNDPKKMAADLEQLDALRLRAGGVFGRIAAYLGKGGAYASLSNPVELAEAVALVLVLMRRIDPGSVCPSEAFGERLRLLDSKVWPWDKAPTTPDEVRALYVRLIDDASYDDSCYDQDDPGHGNSYTE